VAKLYIIFIILIFLPVFLFPQNNDIKFDHISGEQGLSNDIVFCVLQDCKGFMWFGTEDGLNKYDGYKFTIYKHDPDNPSSLSNNEVTDIYEDQSTNLWIATIGGGLNKFEPEAEKFTHYKYDQKNPVSISSNYMKQITGFKYGDRDVLWIGTAYGLNKFDIETEQFTRYPATDQDYPYNYVEAVVVDSSGKVWIGCSSGGLHRFDPEAEKYVHYRHDPNNHHTMSSNLIWSLLVDQSGILWIGTDGGGLNKFDNEVEQFAHYRHDPNNPNSLSDNRIPSIYEDKAGTLWIGTWEGGINKFDRKTQQFTQYKHDPHRPYSLSINSIQSIYQDKSDVLWIGTWQGGLNKFNPQSTQFTHPHFEPYLEDLNLPVWGITESQSGVLWVGTWGKGLVKINRKQDKVSRFLYEPDNPNSLSNNIVSQIIKSRHGGIDVLWIGTFNGLNKLDLNTEQITRYFYIPDEADNTIRSVYEDKAGTLWVATQNAGLKKFDQETGQFILVGRRMQIMQVYEDKSGAFWVATLQGLKKLDRETGQFTTYRHDPDDANSINNNQIISINETSFEGKDVLWVGTVGGLNKFDRESEKFISYTTKDGLPSDVINGILADNQGKLWLSTANGLSKFNPKIETFRNYNIRDGLRSNQFVDGVFLKSSDGAMFFGGIKGIDAFYPDNIKDNPWIPPVVITDFQIFNNPVKIKRENSAGSENGYFLPKSINKIKEIELSYTENVFSFEFAALDYRSPQKNKYAYLMEGVDPDWVYTDASRRFATYTNLDPGEYTFRVKGSNNDGIWNEAGTLIKIFITPPWWETNLAYMFYVFLFGFIVFGFWRFQTNRLKIRHQMEMDHLQTEKLEEVDRLKSRFFANISHEFRTPLTLILGPVEQMLSGEFKGNMKEQLKIIIRNGKRLLQLINQLLDLSKLESGKLKLQAQAKEIISFTNGLVQVFESLAVRKEITLKFKSELKSQEVFIDVDKYEKIINNLLSNAFKFTLEGGMVEVVVSEPTPPFGHPSQEGNPKQSPLSGGDLGVGKILTGLVQIQVSNTGPGIPSEQLDRIFDRFYQVDDSYSKDSEGTGIGLALTKELVELHHGEIFVESEASAKTTFTVFLPLGKEYLKEDEIIETTPQISPLTKGGQRVVSVPDISISELEGKKEISKIQKQKDLPTILIVEDNADLRQYIRSSMENNYQILEAENGEEGLAKATEEIPDLIISDVMMPKMDGFEFCAKIKTDERTSHIPVILITARAATEDKIEGLETGADDYITKPFDNKELNVRVKNLIEQRNKLREKFSQMIDIKPVEIAATSTDEQFVKRLLDIFETHVAESDFSTEDFAREVGMSRSNLHRKLQALTNQPTHEFLRSLRLKRAAQLLKKSAASVTEVAYAVGFNNLSHFTKIFRQQFGQSPSEFASKNQSSNSNTS
jgi:signal transduction histidine kinase/ligand-binding sensor domain-containing protein/AraC-like DNA-binding protein